MAAGRGKTEKFERYPKSPGERQGIPDEKLPNLLLASMVQAHAVGKVGLTEDTFAAIQKEPSCGMAGGSSSSEIPLHSGQEESSQERFDSDTAWAATGHVHSSNLVTVLTSSYYHGRTETVIKAAS